MFQILQRRKEHNLEILKEKEKMDFFHLFEDDERKVVPLSPKVVRRLNMRTPPTSPSRLKIPELVESDESSNEGRELETVCLH